MTPSMTTATSANGLARRLGALEAAVRPVDPLATRRALAASVLTRLQEPVYRAHWAAISRAVLRGEHGYCFEAAYMAPGAAQRAGLPATSRPTYTRRIVLHYEDGSTDSREDVSAQDSRQDAAAVTADVPVRYCVLWHRQDWWRGARAQSSIVDVTVMIVAAGIIDGVRGEQER